MEEEDRRRDCPITLGGRHQPGKINRYHRHLPRNGFQAGHRHTTHRVRHPAYHHQRLSSRSERHGRARTQAARRSHLQILPGTHITVASASARSKLGRPHHRQTDAGHSPYEMVYGASPVLPINMKMKTWLKVERNREMTTAELSAAWMKQLKRKTEDMVNERQKMEDVPRASTTNHENVQSIGSVPSSKSAFSCSHMTLPLTISGRAVSQTAGSDPTSFGISYRASLNYLTDWNALTSCNFSPPRASGATFRARPHRRRGRQGGFGRRFFKRRERPRGSCPRRRGRGRW